jgi:hypothetical protein
MIVQIFLGLCIKVALGTLKCPRIASLSVSRNIFLENILFANIAFNLFVEVKSRHFEKFSEFGE